MGECSVLWYVLARQTKHYLYYRPWESVLSSGLSWLDKLSITLPGPSGEVPLRKVKGLLMYLNYEMNGLF
jgi:hypothetical protein